MATLIAETKNIKFAPAVLNLPHYHPACAAAHAAMFDHLSQGRFILGIGTGSTAFDFKMERLDGKVAITRSPDTFPQAPKL